MNVYDLQARSFIIENEMLSDLKAKHYSRQSNLWFQHGESVYYFKIEHKTRTDADRVKSGPESNYSFENAKVELIELNMKSKEKAEVVYQEMTKLEGKPLREEGLIQMDSVSAAIFVNNETGKDYDIKEHYVGLFAR